MGAWNPVFLAEVLRFACLVISLEVEADILRLGIRSALVSTNDTFEKRFCDE